MRSFQFEPVYAVCCSVYCCLSKSDIFTLWTIECLWECHLSPNYCTTPLPSHSHIQGWSIAFLPAYVSHLVGEKPRGPSVTDAFHRVFIPLPGFPLLSSCSYTYSHSHPLGSFVPWSFRFGLVFVFSKCNWFQISFCHALSERENWRSRKHYSGELAVTNVKKYSFRCCVRFRSNILQYLHVQTCRVLGTGLGARPRTPGADVTFCIWLHMCICFWNLHVICFWVCYICIRRNAS